MVTAATDPLLLPIFAHVLLCLALYAGLTIARAPAVWGMAKTFGDALAALEPKISANLSNQFEWPLLFYVAVLLLMLRGEAPSSAQLTLAWSFVGGRVVHSLVQIFLASIRLRGVVFTINFLAVLGLWWTLLPANG